MTQVHPIILSGGAGTRLWPLSRQLRPKQFLDFDGRGSLFAQTLKRVHGEIFKAPIIISSDEHRFLIGEELRCADIKSAEILLEPKARNTAPAIAIAALQAIRRENNALILVLPSDHFIENHDAFEQSVSAAIPLASNSYLVTFGVAADRPHTGYGYVQRGAVLSDSCWKVEKFIEKPNKRAAEEYVEAGTYFWNAGIFLFKASVYLNELGLIYPDIVESAKEAVNGQYEDLGFLRLRSEAFSRMPSISVDYALFEKTKKAAVVALKSVWNDVGSWESLRDIKDANKDGNVTIGDTLVLESKNSYIRSEQPLVATIGVEDMYIVATDDAVLVAAKEHTEKVREVVSSLRKLDRQEIISHSRVYRPWGYYQNLESGQGFLVKRIVVNPGAKLSLQLHNHRAEHWVVVKGAARVTNGDQKLNLEANESIFIPRGNKHRLENLGAGPLHLIEVQTGDQISEDDIVRFEDTYGRV